MFRLMLSLSMLVYSSISCPLILAYLIFQVDSAWSAGNYEEAKRNATKAKIINIIGFVVGFLIIIAVVVVIILETVALRASRQQVSTQQF